MTGYLLALLSSLFFSLYIIPRKLSTLPPVLFSLFMALGFFLSTVLLYFFQSIIKFHESPSPILFLSVGAGFIWAVSFVFFVTSIDRIGLSRSNQWKNLQGPVGVFLSLLLLGEFATTNPWFAALAAVSIFVSALFFSTTSSSVKKQIDKKGIYFALVSAFGFGTVATIQKYVTAHVGIYLQQVVWSFSIFMFLLIYISFHKKVAEAMHSSRREVLLGLGAGVCYLGASLCQLFSYKYIPAAIGFTVIQLNTFWTIAMGICIFKEIQIKKYALQITLGFLFTLLGIVFLVFARK